MSFQTYHFKSFINEALKELKFIEPKPIQKEIIPLILDGKNVIGQSETGSGKSHAFLLPIFQQIAPLGHVQVVITSPTRELAKQIYDMALAIAKHSEEPFRIKCYVGGTDREKELVWLENNQPDIVIGTPGRVWDYAFKERKLFVHQTKFFIVDEADMALESGFLVEMDNIASLMPKELIMCVFSATIPEGLKPFLKKYMENPLYVDLTKLNVTPKKLEHYLIKTKGKDKFKLLQKIMNIINPYLCIIFTKTKEEAKELSEQLRSQGMTIGELHGDLTSRERARMMREVRDLRYTYIVATDIASRGIDIEGVTHVINYSLPNNEEFYIHRAGRTSRNNLSGIVYSLYDFDDDTYLNKLENLQIKFTNIDIKNGEFVEVKERNFRKKFVKNVIANKKPIAKPKKVKPNYKKKLKQNRRG